MTGAASTIARRVDDLDGVIHPSRSKRKHRVADLPGIDDDMMMNSA